MLSFDDFKKENQELVDEILSIFDVKNCDDFEGDVLVVSTEDLCNYETSCGEVGEKISDEAIEYLHERGVEFVVIVVFYGGIVSLFAPLNCCEASVFEYIVNSGGNSIIVEKCHYHGEIQHLYYGKDKNWSHFESE